MLLTPWLRSLRHNLTTACRRNSRRHMAVRPCLESLEDRRLLSASAIFDPGWVTSSTIQNGELLLTLNAGQQAGDGQVDVFEVQRDGNQLVLRVNGADAYRGAVEVPTSLVLQGSADQDTFIVNADALPLLDVTASGAGIGDRLLIQGGFAQSVTQQIGPVGGTFVLDGSVLRYDEIDEVADSLSTASRTYQFSAVDAIGLTAVGGTATIATAAQSVSFVLPFSALTLDSRDSSASTLTVGDVRATTNTVTVRGDATDTVRFDGDVSLGTDLSVTAGHVSFSNHLSLSGTLDVQASASITVEASASIAAYSGSVLLDAGAGTLRVSGKIDVSGDGFDPNALTAKGGIVHLLAADVRLLGVAQIEATGQSGGGTILVGGDFQGRNTEIRNARRTTVGSSVRLSADALTRGDGGKVIVWADGQTSFAGTITARGGSESGNGGLAETSGKEFLTFTGFANLSAAHGAAGRLLLDPKNITIASGGTDSADSADNNFDDNPSGDVTISAASITAITNTGTAVELQANNDITVNQAISTDNSSGTGGNITLRAGRSIFVNQAITTDDGSLTLVANETAANGVVDAFRDAGDAAIVIFAGISAGAGAISITMSDGFGLTNRDSGFIYLTSSISTTGSLSITQNGTEGTTGKGIIIDHGSMSVRDGDLTLTALQTVTGHSSGVYLDHGILETTGVGNIIVQGRGGDDLGNSNFNVGVFINLGSEIRSTAAGLGANQGTISITGYGGSGVENNQGIGLGGAGALVTSVSGNIELTGNGGTGTGFGNTGIEINSGGRVVSTGTATIILSGTGGEGTSSNYGVQLATNGAAITSVTGDIEITGTAGIGTDAFGAGVLFQNSSSVTSTGTAKIDITGNGGSGTVDCIGIWLVDAGSSVTSVDGAIHLTGIGGDGTGVQNAGVVIGGGSTVTSTGTATIDIIGTGGMGTSDAIGVWLLVGGSAITSVAGAITVMGTGGAGTQSNNTGVRVDGTARIESTGSATIDVTGIGGANSQGQNFGVQVTGSGAAIISTATGTGTVTVTGTGGAGGFNDLDVGVSVQAGGMIASDNTADLEIRGTGGSGPANNLAYGVWLTDSGSEIRVKDGTLEITGEGGLGGNVGIVAQDGLISSTGSGSVFLTADKLSLLGTNTVIDAGTNSVSIDTLTADRDIRLGDADLTCALGIADDELDLISAGTLEIGEYASNQVTVTGGPISPANVSILTVSGTNILVLTSIVTAGTQLDLLASGNLTIGGSINGTGNFRLFADDTIFVNAHAIITATGTGTLRLAGNSGSGATRIMVGQNAELSVEDGDLTLDADIGGAGNFAGVTVDGATLTTSGTGSIQLTGQGSNDNSTDLHAGVLLSSSTIIQSTALGLTSGQGEISIMGTGGRGTSGSYGIALFSGAGVSTVSGHVTVQGFGGFGTGSTGIYSQGGTFTTTGVGQLALSGFGGNDNLEFGGNHYGVLLTQGSLVQSTASGLTIGQGTISIFALGGAVTGFNRGLSVEDSTTVLSTVDGDVSVNARGGIGAQGNNVGITITGGATVETTGAGKLRLVGYGGIGGTGGEVGLVVSDGATVRSTGSGFTGDAATLELVGYGGNDGNGNSGVVVLDSATTISSVEGELTLTGYGGNTSGGAHVGVQVQRARVQSTGIANVSLFGFGGGDGSDVVGANYGVLIQNGALIESTSSSVGAAEGLIHLEGSGGQGGGDNRGVALFDFGTTVRSQGGNIELTGVGGNGDDGNHIGISNLGAQIVQFGSGPITLNGTGGSGGGSNGGVLISDTSGLILSASGNISINGSGGSGTGGFHDGVVINHGATVRSITGSLVGLYGIAGTGDSVGTDILDGSRVTANANSIQLFVIGDPAGPRSLLRVTGNSVVQAQDTLEIRADTIALAGTQSLAATDVTINTHIGGRDFNLGGDDSDTHLGLTNAELTSIFATNLRIGETTASLTTVVGPISPANVTGTLSIFGTDIVVNGAITSSGTQLDLIASHDLTINSPISGSGSFQLSADRTVTVSGDVTAVGAGNILVTGNSSGGARNIVVNGAVLSVVNGNLLLDADRGSIAGTHIGVTLTDATLRTSGSGMITVFGHGGDDAGTSSLQGIALFANALIESTSTAGTAGGIELTGFGGAGTFFNTGIATNDSTARIQSAGGLINIAGHGGAGTEFGNFGVFLGFGGQVIGTGSADVHVYGMAGTGTDDSAGVSVFGTGSRITAEDGEIDITAYGNGSGARNIGLGIQAAGRVESTGSGTVHIFGKGGNGTDENFGVLFEVDQNVVIADGNLMIEGYAGDATGINNVGVVIRSTGAVVSTGIGEISIEGYASLTGSGGSRGVDISNLATVTGAANITIKGFGRDNLIGGNAGVTIDQGSGVTGTGTGAILIEGHGAHGFSDNYGVLVDGALVYSYAGGDLTINGFGGLGTGLRNIGLIVQNAAIIGADGVGNVTLSGDAGDEPGSDEGHGLIIRGSTTEVRAADGSLSLTGYGANSGTVSRGIWLDDNALVNTVGAGFTYLTGFGGDGAAVSRGLVISNSARLQSTSAMYITGYGGNSTTGDSVGVLVDDGQIQGDGFTIDLRGYGGGYSGSRGVVLTGAATLLDVEGSLLIRGQSSGTIGDGNDAVEILDGAQLIASAAGSVVVTGYAGAADNNNVGILVSGAGTLISVANGEISLTGFGGNAPGTGNNGVQLVQGARLVATGTGDISLTGYSHANSTGLVLEETGTPAIVSAGGDVFLAADSQAYLGSGPIVSNTSGTVVVRVANAATLQIGGTAGAGTLLLTDAQLDLIEADRLVLDATPLGFAGFSGTVVVNSDLDPALATDLTFVGLIYNINANITANRNLTLWTNESSLTGVVSTSPPFGGMVTTDQADRLRAAPSGLITIGDERFFTALTIDGAGITAASDLLLTDGFRVRIDAPVATTSGADLTLQSLTVEVAQAVTSGNNLAIIQAGSNSLTLFLAAPDILQWGVGPAVLTIGDQGRTGSVTVASTLQGERNFGIGSGGSIFTHLIQLLDGASANLVAGQLGNSDSIIGPFEALGTGTPNVAFTGGAFNDRVTTAPSTVPFFLDVGAGQDSLILDYSGLSGVTLNRGIPGSGSVSAIDESHGPVALSFASIEQFGAVRAPFNALANSGNVHLVTQVGMASDTVETGTESTTQALSADGRYAVFSTYAPNLASGVTDTNNALDVYLYDRTTGASTLISSRAGDSRTAANGDSYDAKISADGRFVAFVSTASDLVEGVTSTTVQVYVFDRDTGVRTLVSRATGNPLVAGNAPAASFRLSADGSTIAFQSEATNLVDGQVGGGTNVFAYHRTGADFSTATMTLVSHQFGASLAAVDAAYLDDVSDNGRYVLISSNDSRLAANDTNGKYDVFLVDVLSGSTTLVSHSVSDPSTTGDDDSYSGQFSGNGQFVIFLSNAGNLTAGQTAGPAVDGLDLFLFNVTTGTTQLVTHANGDVTLTTRGTNRASISDDGRWIAYEQHLSSGFVTNVYLYDVMTDTRVLVSADEFGAATNNGELPVISGDGSTVIYLDHSQLYRYDRSSGSRLLVSHDFSNDTVVANHLASHGLTLSADASYILFSSLASNLTGDADLNRNRDLFLYSVSSGASTLVGRREGQASTTPTSFVSELQSVESISDDGRYVVFTSPAVSLVSGQIDANDDSDLFLYDTVDNTVTLINHQFGFSTTVADGYSHDAAISGDGRYVVYLSSASNLTAVATDGQRNVFVYDVHTGINSLVSHVVGNPDVGNGASAEPPVISADGSHIGFTNGQVYLYDRAAGTRMLASPQLTTGMPSLGSQYFSLSISGDGSRLAYTSDAADLVATDTNGRRDVFVYDAGLNTVWLVSVNALGTDSGDNVSELCVISRDGSTVVFNSGATNLVAGQVTTHMFGLDVFRRTLGMSPVTELVSHASGSPTTTGNAGFDYDAGMAVSDDGRFVVFAGPASDYTVNFIGTQNVFLYDSSSPYDDLKLVSHEFQQPDLATDGFTPRISGDGQFITYQSSFGNQSYLQTPSAGTLFVYRYNRLADSTSLVSHTGDYVTNGNGDSTQALISHDGRSVAFISSASNLTGNDFNFANDLFDFTAFATTQSASIQGTASVDFDGDGTLDDLLAGVVFELYDATDPMDLVLVATATSDANGVYFFAGLFAGDYIVRAQAGSDLYFTAPTSSTDGYFQYFVHVEDGDASIFNDFTAFILNGATVSIWDGGGDGVNWSNAANWAGDALPGFNSEVFIDAGTPIHIDTNVFVHGLHVSRDITLDAGFTLFVNHTSQVSPGSRFEALAGSTVLVDSDDASFFVHAGRLVGANIQITHGAFASFVVDEYAFPPSGPIVPVGAATSIMADTGSHLSLSLGAALVNSGGLPLFIQARGGSTVELTTPSVQGAVSAFASEAGSVLNLQSVATFTGPAFSPSPLFVGATQGASFFAALAGTTFENVLLLGSGDLFNPLILDTGTTFFGNGFVQGPVTVAPGATDISVSASGSGSLSAMLVFQDDLILDSGVTFGGTLHGLRPGFGYSIVAVTGTVALNNAQLSFSRHGFTPQAGDTFTIIDNLGSGPVVGTFAGLAEGAIVLIEGQAFSITYAGGPGGNNVVLTAFDQPTIVSIAQEGPRETGADSVSYLVTFSTTVTGVDVTDFYVYHFGGVAASRVEVTALTGSTYRVTLSGITGSGDIGIQFQENSSVRDLNGASLLASGFSAQFLPTGNVPAGVVGADINGDGFADILTANSADGNLSVLLDTGSGFFAAAPTISIGMPPGAIAVGDLDADGIKDLVVTIVGGSSVAVLYGTGFGNFDAPVFLPTGGAPNSVILADLNHDGQLDIVTANGADGTVSVLLANGLSFNPAVDYAVGSGPLSLVAADVNRDGEIDLAVVNRNDNTISLLAGNGDGMFGAQAVFGAGGSPYSATSLAVGDLNGDGLLDFVTANEYDNTVSVLLQDAGGMFTETMYSTITRPQSVSVGDFNRDGRMDVAVAGEGVLAIMPGDGTGALVATQPIVSGGLGNSFAATADLDNDGDPDLLFVNSGNLQVVAVRNLRSAADFDQGRFFGALSYTIDGTSPKITSIARQNPAGPSTSATSLTWLVTFSEEVTGVAQGNFSAMLGGSATGAVTGFMQVDGSQYTVTVTGVSGTGSVTLRFTDSGAIQDLRGNHLVRTDGQPALQAPVQVLYDSLFANATEVADFDGDGNLDLVSVGSLGEGTGAIAVSLGNGDGTFQAANGFNSLSTVTAVVVGDLDRDGHLDLVVTNSNSGSISVFLGNGDGSFEASLDFATGLSPFGLAIGDVDGDGILDVVVTSLNDNVVNVFHGVGDGSLMPLGGVPVGMAPKGVELADLNGDGILDLVVANAFDATVSIALGRGLGNFDPAVAFNVGSYPFTVAVADLNGDGIPDLAVSNYYSNSVSVLLGAGDGSFGAAVAYQTGVEPYSVAIADLNGDSIQDLLVANAGDNTVGVLLSNGDGTFKAHQSIFTGSSPVQALTTDINGDGRLDVVVLNADDPSVLIASTVSILLGANAGTFDGQSYTLNFGTLKTFVGTVDGSLSNAANWLGNVLPDLGDDILINSPVNRTLLYDLPPGAFFGQITFTGGGVYTLSPSGFTDVTATNFNVTGTTTVTVSVTGVLNSSAVFTAEAGSSLVYSGTIVGMGSLILDGLGSKTLAASNTFSGTTFVQAGDATIADPGAVPRALTAAGSSTLHLGSGSNSALAHVGDLSLSFSTLQIDINGALPEESYDQLQVTGTVSLGTNAVLDLSRGGYLPVNGTEFVIIDNDGTNDAVIGTFSGLTEGATVFVNNKAFVISYVGGDGNDVTLTAIATTRVWDGGGLTGLLSDPLNWVGDIAPLFGDNLQFPAITGNHALINDLVGPGMGVAQVERIGLQDSYTFTGLALSVTTSIFVTPGTSSTFNLLLTLGTTGLQVQAGSTLTLAGGINGGSFLKTGGGTLALGGSVTLTGSSSVNAGTLLGTGAIFIGLPSISLLPGTTLAGTGVDGASVTVTGGTVSPGMSPGQLAAQDVNFASGPQASSLVIELNGPLASDQDTVVVHGLELGNVALDLRLNFVFDIGTTIRLVTVSGPDPVSGQFTNFAEGQRLTQSGRQYRLTYIGGDGNDIELQVLAPDVGDSIDQALPLDLSNIFGNSAPGAPATVTFPGLIDDARDTDFFVFTATRSGLVEVRQNSPVLNSFLFIYNSQRQLLAYDNDSGGGGNSAVRFQVERGRQYFIRTTAVGISTGAYNLVFTYFTDQIGDDFYDAFDLTHLVDTLGNLQFNVDPGLPVVDPIAGGILPRTTIDFAGDVDVLRYVAQVTGRLTVTQSRTAAQTGLDSVLDAFRETSRTANDASAVFLTGNDDLDATRVSQVTFNIQQGQAYYIRVSGFGATAGDWALSFQTDTTTVDPEGDIQADAQPVTLAPKANGTGDTADVSGSIDRDGDVDYLRFTPSVTGQASVLLTSALPLILDVFSGSVRIASDRSPGDGTLVTFDVIAGQTYFLRVATAIPGTPAPQGLRGTYSLRIETTSGPLTPQPGVTVTDQQLNDLYAILIEALVQESTRSVRPLAEIARAVNAIIVQAFINQQGGIQAFSIPAGLFYFDPVDFIVTESQGRQAGFTKAEGVVNEFGPKAKYTGDGAAELLIIPNITASTYNLQFVGVGAGSFLAGANFIGARGGVSAVTIADTLFKGTTSLLLDFSGRSTGVTASSGPNSSSISVNNGTSLSLGTGFSTSSISSLVALVTLGGLTATGGGGDSGLVADSRGGGGGTPDAILDDLFGFLPTPVRKAVDKLVRPLLEDLDPADLKTVEMLEQILMDLFFPNASKRKAKNVNKTPSAAQEAKTDPRRDAEQSQRSAPAKPVAGQNPARPASTPANPTSAQNPAGNRPENSVPPVENSGAKAAESRD